MHARRGIHDKELIDGEIIMASLIFKRDVETAKKVLKPWQLLLWKTKTRLILLHVYRHFGKYSGYIDNDKIIIDDEGANAEELKDKIFNPLSDIALQGMIRSRNFYAKKFKNIVLTQNSSFNDYMLAAGIIIEVK